jgi:hypothetical protein
MTCWRGANETVRVTLYSVLPSQHHTRRCVSLQAGRRLPTTQNLIRASTIFILSVYSLYHTARINVTHMVTASADP